MARTMGVDGAPVAAAALLLGLLTATVTPDSAAAARPDGVEPVNRAMFTVNDWVVENVIEPGAWFLRTYTPGPIKHVAANFYENLTEPEFVVANWFVGDKRAASDSLRRFIINTTAGVGGLFDVASAMGIHRKDTHWGAALCHAGVPIGSYLVLPLIGSTNVGVATSTTVFFVGGYYALNLISPWLAIADLVIDLSGSAASLRYVEDRPDLTAYDPYMKQQVIYWEYLERECPHISRPAQSMTTVEAPTRSID